MIESNNKIEGIDMAFCMLAEKRKLPLKTKNTDEYCILRVKSEDLNLEFEIQEQRLEKAKQLAKEFEEKDIIKYIFQKENDYSISYEYSTAKEIADLVIHILGIKKDDRILDAFSGTGSFSFEVFDKTQNSNIDAYDINSNFILISKIRNYAKGTNINFIQRDILRNNLDEKKYDVAFGDMPLLSFYHNDILESLNNEIKKLKITVNKKVALSWVIALKIINYLKDDGKAIITTENASLFNLQDKSIRKILIENGYIDSIIELPEKLLDNTAVPITLILLTKNNNKKVIDFVDLKECFIEQRRKNLLDLDKALKEYKNKNSIPYEEIERLDYSLNPKLYSKKEIIVLEDPKTLSEVTKDIFRGYQITASELDQFIVKNEKEANCKIIEISDIDNEGNLSENIKMINTKDKKLDRYLLQDGDILLSARGDRIKKHMINIKNNERIIVNGSVNVIRADKEKINPMYLNMFLESQKGIATLNRIKTGIVIPTLNIGPLSKIKISCPSLEKQNELVKEYKTELQLMNITKERLKELKEKIDKIVNKI